MSNKVKGSGLVPKLRFPEFRDEGEWEEKQVGEVFKVTRGEVLSMTLVQDKKTNEASYPVYSSQTKNNGLSGYYSDFLYEDAITWTTDGANAGDVNYRSGKFYCTNVCGVLINTNGYANPCIAALINSVSRSHVSYVGNPKLMNGVMAKITIPFPTVEEQQKIADCLASIDERITREAQKLDTLKTHKKGLMQQLFPAEGETLPKLRFPEFRDAGEWEFVPLKELASRRTERNSDGKLVRVLTNSAEHGVVDQRDYFDKDIATQGNLENYLIVDSGDFVYNPRISTFAPVGPISRNRIAKGVMSPLYTVFRFKNSGIDFYAHYFKTSAWHLYMRQVGSTGARHDRMAIANDDFLAMPLPAPSQEEQQKIADCLTSLDDLITAQTQKLAALKTHKKGLMQQLFPFADEVQ